MINKWYTGFDTCSVWLGRPEHEENTHLAHTTYRAHNASQVPVGEHHALLGKLSKVGRGDGPVVPRVPVVGGKRWRSTVGVSSARLGVATGPLYP